MTVHILIIEDEPLVAQRLIRLTRNILAEKLSGVDHCTNINDAETIIAKNSIDLILLDLNLSGKDGFDILKKFAAKAAHTIVVSAETTRALEAFEFGVLDFVPKPFTQDRLTKALTRLWQLPDNQNDTYPPTKHVAFETGGGIEIVNVEEIQFFKGADKYSEAVLSTGIVKFHTKSLNRLQDILSTFFMRTHKSYLVRRDAIQAVRSLEGSRYELDLVTGESLPVGRTRIDHVRQYLAQQHSY